MRRVAIKHSNDQKNLKTGAVKSNALSIRESKEKVAKQQAPQSDVTEAQLYKQLMSKVKQTKDQKQQEKKTAHYSSASTAAVAYNSY
jgi:hypothetical protein